MPARHSVSLGVKNNGEHLAIMEPVDLSLTETGKINLLLKGVKQDQDIPECCIESSRLGHESNQEYTLKDTLMQRCSDFNPQR